MKKVLVTGATGSIGEEIVKEYAKNGFFVYIHYNSNHQKAQNLLEEIDNKGELISFDIKDKESIKNSLENLDVDVLINNAGISQEGLFTDVTEEEWQKIINTNLNSVFYCNQQALKYMIQEQQGCIINISSIWGETGASCEVAYSTTKAAINGMTKALAKEVGPSNIRVNAIAPGIIDTDMNRNLTNEELEQIKEQIPLNKIGKALDIAKCVKWLIEDEYTTGQIISINGGWYI